MREDSDNQFSQGLIQNKIFYYSPVYIEPDKRQILRSYNIEIIEPRYLHTDYTQRYLDLIEVMQSNL